ncbi:hypothetical protein NT2_14_00090 [Caenibius tardaugens NBRC 16725]|uniref:DUF1176 domain-containing protein n=1 Tax=Caenibius tardaugens NBRC 16725 TaxID=1219035 RepID=U2YPY4_9SPHN|nr:DUF1176 domain-containing protein [Caenibius tardaugens]AZI35326.1 DUF1176 domain-containing protein [Caenibius tardaugens NBRC 16725]GAD51005.1 hypothetical protein NT2_14_00090 [Caenibius tardaugens NBRC 16725]
MFSKHSIRSDLRNNTLRILSIALAASFAMPALAAPKPAEVKIFGDWAVACDNGQTCEMTALAHGDDVSDTGVDGFDSLADISVKRPGGPAGAVEVWIGFNGFMADNGVPDKSSLYTLAVDGRRIASGRYGESGITYKGAEAMQIAQALGGGHALTLTDATGKAVARNSLDGSSASMRYMDAQQARAGSVTALVAKGSKPASAVPAAAALPVLSIKGSVGTPAVPTAAEIEKMRKLSGCETDGDNRAPFTTAALNGGATLVLLSCGAGAYNSNEVPFVINGSGATRRIEYARFDVQGGWGEEDGRPSLVNSFWDEKALTLSSFVKGRGLGDCGGGESWVWDGAMFRLHNALGMSTCRGSMNWLTTWRANITR